MGFSADRIEDLKTAVAEACTNAIEHGNQENKTASVTVLLTAAPSQLEIKVEDEGLAPMPDSMPEPQWPGTGESSGLAGACFSSHSLSMKWNLLACRTGAIRCAWSFI